MESDFTAPRYNVRAVVRATGLTPDTLRVWERRYGLPHPQRSAGGHRLYSQYDVDMLKWLVAREREGLSISRAVSLWQDLSEHGRDPLRGRPPASNVVGVEGSTAERLRARWLAAVLAFDEALSQQILDEGFALLPAEAVALDVILGALGEIGRAWYAGEATVQQEHFASEMASRRMHRLLGGAPTLTRAGKVLLQCPAEESHSLPLLLLTYQLRQNGWDALFLGADVPTVELEDTVLKTRPNLVVMAAQHSATAAALLDSMVQLGELAVPTAYGGRIFNLVPSLRAKVPGNFLGERLSDAAGRIEEVALSRASPGAAEPVGDEYKAARNDFLAARAEIESRVLSSMPHGALRPAILEQANRGLASAISAALTFGDEALLEHDLAWLRGLLKNRGAEAANLDAFLSAYSAASQRALGRRGGVWVDWLERLATA